MHDIELLSTRVEETVARGELSLRFYHPAHGLLDLNELPYDVSASRRIIQLYDGERHNVS
jgi:hypothetical protein